MKVVVDTSTLVSLAKIGELQRLMRMRKEIIPPELVYDEAMVKGGDMEYEEFEVGIKNLIVENRLSSRVAEIYIIESKSYEKK